MRAAAREAQVPLQDRSIRSRSKEIDTEHATVPVKRIAFYGFLLNTVWEFGQCTVLYDLREWPIEQWLYRSWREKLWADIQSQEVLEIAVGTGKNVPYYPADVHATAIDLSPAEAGMSSAPTPRKM